MILGRLMSGRAFIVVVGMVLFAQTGAWGQSSLFDDPELRAPDVKPSSGASTRPSRAPEPATISPPEDPAPPPTTPAPTVPPQDRPRTTTRPPTSRPPVTRPPVTQRPSTPATPAQPAEPNPDQVFASLYGAMVSKVEATPTPKDDAELAKKLNEAARVAVESPGLQRLLYEKAYTLAIKDPGGTTDGIHAISSLRKLFPAEGELWDERTLVLQEKLWRAAPMSERVLAADMYRRLLQRGAERHVRQSNYTEAMNLIRKATETARNVDADAVEEVKELSRVVVERQRFDRRATELIDGFNKRTIPADRNNLTEAIDLLAGVLPRQAEVRTLPIGDDAELNKVATVLRESTGKVTPVQAALVGDYFRQSADRPATAPGRGGNPYRVHLLRAAAAWYSRFLAMHLPLDGERLRVLLASQQVTEALATVPRPYGFEVGGFGVALLTTIEPHKHRIAGTFSPSGGGFLAMPAANQFGASDAVMALPVSPGESYEVTMQYIGQGAAGIGMVLPVGPSSVAVTRASDGCVISDVRTGVHSFTSRLPDLSRDNDRHTLYARVVTRQTHAAILVAVDGVEVGRWEGRMADLSAPADLNMPDRSCLGIFTRGGKAQITDVSLSVLRGDARLLWIAGPSELPIDGSRPRDAVVTRNGGTSVTYTHNGVTATFDPAIRGGSQITIAEPSEDTRTVRQGFQSMMSSSYNLAPLGTDYVRYKQLLALVQTAPQPYVASEVQKLTQIQAECERATNAEARERSERSLFAAMHLLGDRYQRSSLSWAKTVQKNTSPAEFKMIMEYGKRMSGYSN